MSDYVKKLSQMKSDIGLIQDSIFFEMHNLEQELTKLRDCLKDAANVIGFYGSYIEWNYENQEFGGEFCEFTVTDMEAISLTTSVGGKRAREFQTKYAEIIQQIKKDVK